MIQFTLNCDNEHRFEAWFKSGDAFDQQCARGDVSCPICASGKVSKALMAPAVSAKSNRKVSVSAGHPEQAQIQRKIKELRSKVLSEADYVGENFAREARKMHDREAEHRAIYGEATTEEVSSLVEDGVDFMPLPTLPEDQN